MGQSRRFKRVYRRPPALIQTVEEYIPFVLTEVLREDEPEEVYTPEEEKAINKRLLASISRINPT